MSWLTLYLPLLLHFFQPQNMLKNRFNQDLFPDFLKKQVPGISLQLHNALHYIFFPKSWHLEVLSWKDCPAIDLTFGRGPLPLLSHCKIAVLCHLLGNSMPSVFQPGWAPSQHQKA